LGHSNLGATLRLLFFLAISHLSFPQTTAVPAPDAGAAGKLISQSREWLRDLRDDGITFQGLIVYDWSKAVLKEQGTEEGFGRYSFDLSMPVDGRKALGLEGSAGLVRLKSHIRQFGEIDDGAAQLPSNIDSCSRTTLYELWLEQRFLSSKLRLKGGKIDANTEFDVVQTAGDFLNSSMGYSPTILAFPTYPEPKPGIAAFLQPTSRNVLSLGVFQTAGMGILSIVEPGRNWNIGQGEHPGRVSLGFWRLNGQLAQFDGGRVSGTEGFYFVVEQSGWRHPWMGRGDERKLSTFLQFGYAQGQVSPFTHHAGGGAVLQAPFGKRSQDALGIAATSVRFSSHSGAGFELESELVVETYYKLTISKHFALIPDFQFLHQPGGLLANRDCPLLTSRVVVSF
jgi:carbohydrate-selective porin OprB